MLPPTVFDVSVITAVVELVQFTWTLPYGPEYPEMAGFPDVRLYVTMSAIADAGQSKAMANARAASHPNFGLIRIIEKIPPISLKQDCSREPFFRAAEPSAAWLGDR